MGVPALFRWLSQKYPKIITPVIEEEAQEVDGVKFPVDTTGANPNGEEFDNLYLDMNGIVHPCSHPEDKAAPETEEEMMFEVFKYTDRVVKMVRPRKVLMIAVDGVAPRAKMNQQRSRRFRSAQEARDKDEEKEEFLKMLQGSQNGKPVDEDVHAAITKKTWDSNAITPGTPFMDILAASLRYWVAYKLNTDPAWKTLKIIISDATVPGEGEHKIMEFVRSQRRSPEHDPNTRHVIYGLDADLIMLGLATHEPYFRVLREDVFFQERKKRVCHICGQPGHMAQACRGEAKVKQGDHDEKQNGETLKPFIWLHVSVLREYLAAELYVPSQSFPFDLERALDDWVFMCFFVGNDFLPHLPSLDIREQGIDTLIAIWRDNIPVMGGYVTKDGHVDLDKAQHILAGLAKQEDSIFKRRKQAEDRRERSAKRRRTDQQGGYADSGRTEDPNIESSKRRNRGPKKIEAPSFDNIPFFEPGKAQSSEARNMTHDMFVNRKAIYQANEANKSAAAVLKNRLMGRPEQSEDGSAAAEISANQTDPENGQETTPVTEKRKAEILDEDAGTPGRDSPNPGSTAKPDSDEPPEDNVRLWEEGYSDRYYEHKFKVDPKDIEFRHKVARAYVEGLAWVLLYYFQGCPSWTWYYPYHYAPFAADFVDLDKMSLKFEKGKPFRPFEQLMGVMPVASNHTIPEAFHSLMTDEDSDIVSFYPESFPIDLNGKKMAWQGVALLPFIDEKKLLAAMDTKYPLLTKEENERNQFGKDALFFSTSHSLYEDVVMNFYSKKQGDSKYNINPKRSDGLSGEVEKNESYLPHSSLVCPLASGEMQDIDEDQSINVYFDMPRSKNVHKSMLLRGVVMPKEVLDRADIEATRSRASNSGRFHGGAPLRNDYSRPPHHRGNSNNHANDFNGGNRNNSINYSNPFAAHLNPNFDPNAMSRAPLPPHLAAQQGWLPPPPAQYHNNGGGRPSNDRDGGYYRNDSRNNKHNGQGHGRQNNRGGYNQRGGRDNYGRY